MPKFKGTPGPWATDGEYINDHGNLLYCHIGVPGGGRLADAASNCMASNEQCRANAKLIAAAPELLESLTNLVDLAKLGAAQLGKYHAALAHAEAVIDKATKETPSAVPE